MVPGGKVIFVAIAVLFKARTLILNRLARTDSHTYLHQAANSVSIAYDGIEALFARLQEALDRMKVHIGPGAATGGEALKSVLIKILVHLLHIFALVTIYLDKHDSKHGSVRFIKKKFPPRLRESIRYLV